MNYGSARQAAFDQPDQRGPWVKNPEYECGHGFPPEVLDPVELAAELGTTVNEAIMGIRELVSQGCLVHRYDDLYEFIGPALPMAQAIAGNRGRLG